ncbi:MAG: hypothetical protein DRP76_03780 [Candidatus Omnitrophota bacterium]|nr:MAG: hypothetical protein DRP76_03780 [Candidatus Omnitrophota bacterium]
MIERIVHEIRRSFIYYKEQSEGGRVGAIFFIGGASQIKGLVSTLSGEIGDHCQLFNPFQEMDIVLEKGQFEDIVSQGGSLFSSAAALSLGAALAEKKRAIINFLPLELKIKEQIARREFVMVIVGICLIFLLGVAWFNFFIKNKMLKDKLSVVNYQIDRIRYAVKTQEELNQQIEKINQKSALINQMLKQRLDISAILKELASLIPPEILVEEFRMGQVKSTISQVGGEMSQEMHPAPDFEMSASGRSEGDAVPRQKKYRMQIKASIFADYERATEVVEQFRRVLEDRGYFKNIKIKPPELEKISPLGANVQGFSLTPVKLRKFSLEAELVGGE